MTSRVYHTPCDGPASQAQQEIRNPARNLALTGRILASGGRAHQCGACTSTAEEATYRSMPATSRILTDPFNPAAREGGAGTGKKRRSSAF